MIKFLPSILVYAWRLGKHIDFLSFFLNIFIVFSSGSGLALVFLAKLLQSHQIYPVFMSTDINSMAATFTQNTFTKNLASVDSIITSITDGLRIDGLVDVLVCNPPYVPTEEEDEYEKNEKEMEKDGLEEGGDKKSSLLPSPSTFNHSHDILSKSWCGGAPNGRFWIDKIVAKASKLLSPNGVFLMIAIEANKPKEILEMAQKNYNLKGTILLCRKAGIEHLYAIKFEKMK